MIDVPPRNPRGWGLGTVWPIALVVLGSPIGLVVLLLWDGNPRTGGDLGLTLSLFAGFTVVALAGAICATGFLCKRAAIKKCEADAKLGSESPQLAILWQNFEPASRWLLKPMETYPKEAASNLRASFPGRIAFVPLSITTKLIANASPPGLLEMEEIGGTFNWLELFWICWPLYFLSGNAFKGVTALGTGAPLGWMGVLHIICLVIWTPFALLAFFWIVSVLGERFELLKTTRGIVRAGPGWVDHPDGRRWTVEDSVLVIREEWPGKKPGYSATLLGPTSAITIQIGKGKSRAFINLWQRWTTPVPRIDLFTPRDDNQPRGIIGRGLRRTLKWNRLRKRG